MSAAIHTITTYKVEYGPQPVQGYSEIDKFLDWLRDLQSNQVEGIWINESEEDIEIDFDTLEQYKDDEVWGDAVKDIIKYSDKSNGFARLAIF